VIAFVGTTACSAARSEAHAVAVAASDAPPRWVGPANVPLAIEPDVASRDLAALHAVLSFWGRSTRNTPEGADAAPRSGSAEPLLTFDMERMARAAGLTAFTFHGTIGDVVYELHAGRPVVVRVTGAGDPTVRRHFEVVVACDPGARRLRSFDPARGVVERSYSRFQDEWEAAQQLTLVMFASDDATGRLSSIAPGTPDERQQPAPSGFSAAPPSRDALHYHRPGESPSPHVAQR